MPNGQGGWFSWLTPEVARNVAQQQAAVSPEAGRYLEQEEEPLETWVEGGKYYARFADGHIEVYDPATDTVQNVEGGFYPPKPTEPPPEGYEWKLVEGLTDLGESAGYSWKLGEVQEPYQYPAPGGEVPADPYGRRATWTSRLGEWDYPPNWGVDPSRLRAEPETGYGAPGEVYVQPGGAGRYWVNDRGKWLMFDPWDPAGSDLTKEELVGYQQRAQSWQSFQAGEPWLSPERGWITPPGWQSPQQQQQQAAEVARWEQQFQQEQTNWEAQQAFQQQQAALGQQQYQQSLALQREQFLGTAQANWQSQMLEYGRNPRSWIDYWQMGQGTPPAYEGGVFMAGTPSEATPPMPGWLSPLLGNGGWGNWKMPSRQQFNRLSGTQQQGLMGYVDWLPGMHEADFWSKTQNLWPQWISRQGNWVPARQRGF